MQVLYFPVPVQAASQSMPQMQSMNQLNHLNQFGQLNQLNQMGQQVINFAPVPAPQQALQRPAAAQPVQQVAAPQPVAVPQPQQVAAPAVATPTAQAAKRVPRQPRVGHSGDRRSGRSPPRNTDWICVSCSNCNWESRKWCKRCGTMKPNAEGAQTTPVQTETRTPQVQAPIPVSTSVVDDVTQKTVKSVEMGGNNGSSSSLTSSVGPVSSVNDEVALMTTIAEEDSDDDSGEEENLFQSQLLELVEAVRISSLGQEEEAAAQCESPFLAMFEKSRRQ